MADIIGRAVIQVVSEIQRADFQKTGSTAGAVLTGALKTTAVAAGAGIGALVGGAIYKGFQRLSAIEQAEAKLKGLGNSAKTVTQIMEDALASVKGTAFGLDEAASIAASAVASGVKPGQELERTLRLVADAATIGGTSLAEMGAIFNKVSATGKAQGEVLNQLGERGIPIIQLLAKSLGVTNAEVVDLASQGKISFAEFQKAIEEGMGGAALKSGETFEGALKNAEAALGRLGAALLGPSFKTAPGALQKITEKLDDMLPAAEKVGRALRDVFPSAPEPPGTGTVLLPGAEGPDLGTFKTALQTATDEAAQEAGESFWTKFWQAVFESDQSRSPAGLFWQDIVEGGLVDSVSKELEGAETAIREWFASVWEDIGDGGLVDSVSNMLEAAEAAIGEWFAGLAENWRNGWQNITNIWPEIQGAFQKDWDNLVDNIRSIPKRIREQVGDWRDAGSQLIGGFIEGLKSKVGGLFDFKAIINNALGLPRSITLGDGPGGLIPDKSFTIKAFAGGGPVSGLALVGERGPELLELPAGSYVHSNINSREMLAAASGGDTFNITYTGSMQGLVRELDWRSRYRRVGS